MRAEPESPITWQIEVNPPDEKVEALRGRLREYNRQAGQIHEGIELGIFLKDDEDQLVGGVTAWLWGTAVEIDFLWLSESLRGQGIGQQLMEQIEKAAVERGARQAFLSTFSFQAPDFYKKQGYEIIAAIDGLGNGHQKFFLRKNL